ncbi:hypothetical protein GALMADRAFT_221190 [Galerina marginata CBS 339.88]|uniref:Uncharacterized protein n=1 Tax=Galerina marginata (strain CBS 339.88) TaxID=685588 RepID=A0A067TJD8_GALM3|nr:hypothetical protein GALMADRAFT_221190 [Galerina marginata CBS 339.88]
MCRLKRILPADAVASPPAKRRLTQTSRPESPNVAVIVRDPSVRKTEAMERVQRLETGLSDRYIVALIDLFQEDVSAADVYLTLTREGVRKEWVKARVRHIREEEEVDDDEVL